MRCCASSSCNCWHSCQATSEPGNSSACKLACMYTLRGACCGPYSNAVSTVSVPGTPQDKGIWRFFIVYSTHHHASTLFMHNPAAKYRYASHASHKPPNAFQPRRCRFQTGHMGRQAHQAHQATPLAVIGRVLACTKDHALLARLCLAASLQQPCQSTAALKCKGFLTDGKESASPASRTPLATRPLYQSVARKQK